MFTVDEIKNDYILKFMKELCEKLYTTSFAQYEKALTLIREVLDKGEKPEISKEDFLMLLRPYYWYVHNPGFQDVIDTCEKFMETLKQNKDVLLEETNPITGNDFLAVGTFLANYLDVGKYDTSGWKMLFASPEIGSAVIAEKFAKKLGELNKTDEEIQAMNNLAVLMKDIEGTKHVAYWCLRHIGADFLEQLEIVHSFPPNDQTYILHALDAFPGNKDVIKFYKGFIEKTSYDYLKKEAGKYLGNVE